MAFGQPVTDSATTKSWLDTMRPFTNLTSSTITIYEVAFYVEYLDSGGTVRYFCIAHDVVSGGLAVAAGSTVVVMYTFTANC